jgi:hypothetical protein
MRKNSPAKREHQVLGVISENDIKEFLLDCVNLPNPIDYPENRPHFERWLRRWRHVVAFKTEGESGRLTREECEALAPEVRGALCRIWVERDTRARDWYFYRLRGAYHRTIVKAENPDIIDASDSEEMTRFHKISRGRGDDQHQKVRFFREWTGADLLEDVPRVCPFEAAVYWLQVNQKLMVYCAGPVCSAPYFLREPKAKGQAYCSPECADPARREAKLRWWNENRRTTAKKNARKSSR